MDEIVINGIVYLVMPSEIIEDIYGITIDDEYGLFYTGTKSGIYTEEVIEVPESVTVEGQTYPVVLFNGGMNLEDASSVSEVILPSSILILEMGFWMFTNLQKVTCYAETAPILSGIDFEGTPTTKELYKPASSDYTTWEQATIWKTVHDIYNGFVEIVDGLKYKETSETTVALIGYDETFNQTSITIPSSITHEGNNYTVTEIKKNAFKNYTGLTEVNIPDSVTIINETVFSNVNTQTIHVTNIALNLNINTKIDKFVFKNTVGITFTYGNITETTTEYACECLGLTDTTISTPTLDLTNLTYDNHQLSIYTIKQYAFAYNNSIITLILPDSVTSIGSQAFYGCRGLTSVTIPNSVTSIGYGAFYDCSGLTSVTIGNSVTSIGDSAFQSCSKLTSVTIGNSVTSIGSQAFYYCSSLTSVNIPNSVTSIGNFAFNSCSSLTSVNIPNSVTSIGDSAFQSCSKLTSVTIGNSVTSIGSYAFSDCTGLTSITIGNSVTSIGSGAFSYCGSLTSVILPNNANISSSTFESTGGINVDGIYYGGKETVNIGNYTFNNVGFITFYLNGNATTITPSEVSVINCDGSLSGDIVISSILNYQGINYSVTSIGDSAFSNCSSLTSITIPNSVTSIGSQAFYVCRGLTSVTIPNSVTSIGDSAFSNCNSLTSVTIGNSVTSIGDYMFYFCKNLTSITIGNSVTSIGHDAFGFCSSLTSVTIPNSVTSIGNNAFYGCSGLTSVCLLNPTAPTHNRYNNIFYNTPSTKVLFVPIGATGYSTTWCNTTWTSVNYTMVPTDGINYKLNDINTLNTFSSNNKVETLTIPSTVTYNGNTYSVNKVSRNSLANDNKVKTLTINSGINKIEASALSGCNNLETITIPDTVSKIDNHAFWMCRNLKNIVLPSTLTQLKPELFVDCISLETITIPDGITKIPFRMFEGCKNLKTVNLPSTINKIQWSAFKDCINLTTINIPSGCNVDPTAFEGTNITI